MDITERRRQEAALRDSEERYREVVESQTELVCRHLPDTTLTFVNEAFCRFFRQPREELIGKKFPDLLPRRAHDDVRRLLSVVALHRVPHGGEHELTTGAGVSAWHHWVHHAIVGPGGELEEFQSIGHDITDRKRAEEAQRDLAHASRLAVVGQLTAVIAHEVTQPLAAIMSNADAATRLLDANRLDTQEFRDILVDIRDSDRRADEAIRRIRALLSKREMQRQPVDVNATAADVVHLVAGDALRRRVHVRTSFDPELPAVSADRVHLQQVLLNLIVNAMDAMEETPETAREVTVVTKSHARGGVEVEVRDRGCGIPDEQLRHVFESFFTTKKEGMGMGLSIARSIVEAHGGKIWAEPVEGGGTTFRFVIGSADA
jgi:PAS domain S-box-containing protein